MVLLLIFILKVYNLNWYQNKYVFVVYVLQLMNYDKIFRIIVVKFIMRIKVLIVIIKNIVCFGCYI